MSTPNVQQPMTVEDAEAVVEIFDALERMKATPDYKRVFEQHLFTDEVIRLHGLLAHPDQAMIDSRQRIIDDLDALSNIKFALRLISQMGANTKGQLDEFRAAQFEAENPEGE